MRGASAPMTRGRGMGRALGAIVIGTLAWAALPAFAGTLYRCDGADGARSYTSKRIPGARCTVISYSPKAARATGPAPKANVGSATTASNVAGTPVAASLPATPAAAAPVTAAPVATKPYQPPRLVQGQVY